MPLLAKFIELLFTSFATFLSRLFAARLALRVAAVGTIIVLGTTLMVAFNAFVAPLVAQLFATQYGQLLGLAFPPISGTVMTGIMGLWVACTTYRLQLQAVKVTSGL